MTRLSSSNLCSLSLILDHIEKLDLSAYPDGLLGEQSAYQREKCFNLVKFRQTPPNPITYKNFQTKILKIPPLKIFVTMPMTLSKTSSIYGRHYSILWFLNFNCFFIPKIQSTKISTFPLYPFHAFFTLNIALQTRTMSVCILFMQKSIKMGVKRIETCKSAVIYQT